MITSLESWRPQGRMSVWRYSPMPRMYGGWHLTADNAACTNLLELIEAVSLLSHPTHRTMPVVDPTMISADRIFGDHSLRVMHPPKLRLSFGLSPDAPTGFVETSDRLDLSLGPQGLRDFQQAIIDLRGGVADFSVGFGEDRKDEMTRMTFWWWPKRGLRNDR